MIVYKDIPFRFDIARYAKSVLRAIDMHGADDIAEMIGVDTKTLQNWATGTYKSSPFPYPRMTNFINFCNLMDIDPGQYFTIEDKS